MANGVCIAIPLVKCVRETFLPANIYDPWAKICGQLIWFMNTYFNVRINGYTKTIKIIFPQKYI